MTSIDKIYWLGFSSFPGIGPLRFKLLLKYFGSAKKAYTASSQILKSTGLGTKLTEKFIEFRNSFSLTRYQKELVDKKITTLFSDDKYYPKLLSEISDRPYVLYYRGDLNNIDNFQAKTFAVVGTRKITSYGIEVTRKITSGLVQAGLVIVSGMAYGVDGVAHETAIRNNGKTIAVLGCGVDIIHPASNTTLYWQMVKKSGLVISEYPAGRYAEKGLFPARNRIISGLSLGVIVTEGASDSGALITARYALEQGREVFAVPGPITSELSKGPTILLKDGAKLVSSPADILEELNIVGEIRKNNIEKANPNLTITEKKILEMLQNESLHFDDLLSSVNINADKLATLLTVMELSGFIKKLSDGKFGLG